MNRRFIRKTGILAIIPVLVFLGAFPAPVNGAGILVRERDPGGSVLGSLDLQPSGMVKLASIMDLFKLRSSMDLMGDRLDVVGQSGSCRLLAGSPLVLSRGLFAVLSTPVRFSGAGLSVPLDFLTKSLPGLTGRFMEMDTANSILTVGNPGTGVFSGEKAEGLTKMASFIQRDQYVPEEVLNPAPKGLSVVVLDPGHGGRSLGAKGSSGTTEKALVLSVAEKLRRRLEENLGIKVILTRTADYFVGLKERAAIANNNNADLFISIHANAAFRREVDGIETYYLSLGSGDAHAMEYARVENEALGLKGGPDDEALLEAILWDMAQTSFISQSRDAAALIQESLVAGLKGNDRGVRQAPLAVLMGARMPAVLAEIGFISNPEQEIKLNRESYQEEVARALYSAIERYHRGLLRGEIQGGRP